MVDVGYGNWQVDKCSTNVWIGDPLFMSTLLLNIETICQHSNMLSLSLSTDTRYRSSCSMDILLPERKIFPIKSYLFNILNPSLSSSNKGNKHKAFFIFWKILSWLLTSRLYWDVIPIHEFCRITRTIDCQKIEREGERVLFCLKSRPLFTTPNITFCQPNGPINLRSVTSTYR